MMWTAQELANKIDDEGGAASFMQWGGVRASDVPEELRTDFERLEEAYDEFDEIRTAFMDRLPAPGLD